MVALDYKQLAEGNLILAQFIIKCKLITKAYNFGEAEDKCLRNVILLCVSNHKVYEKCIQESDTLTSTYVIKIMTEVHTSDRQLSLTKSINSGTQAAIIIKSNSKQ